MLKQSSEQSENAAEILREQQQFASERVNLDDQCREIAERIIPNHSKLFLSAGNGYDREQGEKRTDNLFDSTGAIAVNRFAAILDSLLTPRNQTWHRLMVDEPYLARDRAVKLYFDEVNKILFKQRYSPRANFASQNQSNYLSLGAYGTGCVFTDELFGEKGLRYRGIHLSEIYFKENHQGLVDKALRYFPLYPRQAIQMWGEENLPEGIVNAAKSSQNKQFWFVHCVKPRKDYDPERVDYKGMPFASYYISVEGKAELKEEGYQTFPYAISRYQQVPGETYGRGPAMDVLPAIKTLNEQKKTLLKQGHRAVDPVLLAYDDGVLDSFSLLPGKVNYGGVSKDGRPLVHTLPVGNVAVGKDMMDDERALINDAFLVTLFQILVETPQMSATEVLERTREKGILLAPTIGRQQSEYLGPLIEREMDVLSRQGMLPPMPPILREAMGEYRIEYDSPLSRSQRAEEASGIMRTVESLLSIVNVTQNPAPLDYLNWDVIVPEMAEIQGVPAKFLRGEKEVKAIREGRAEEQEAQQAIQAAPAAAAMMKAAAPAPARK